MATTAIKRHITFDPVLDRRAEQRAQQYGVSFPEYVRILIVNDTKPLLHEEVEYIDDPETLESLGRALEDVKHGRYATMKTEEDIDKFIKSL